MTSNITTLVDRLTAALVDQHPAWTIEEVLETVAADTWHEFEQAKRVGNVVGAELYRRAHTEAAQRATAHETLTSG